MNKTIAKSILKLFGWQITGIVPEDLKKCVFVVAPHTSYWDFVWGRMAFAWLGVHSRFLIKKEVFVFPFGGIIKWLGGEPVDRSTRNNTVSQVVDMFNARETFYLTITPEGTRKYNDKWKKGFYHIAMQARVPIMVCYINYQEKKGGVGPLLMPSGDFEKDFAEITEFISAHGGAKYPEQFNLSKYKGDTQMAAGNN